MLTLAQQFVDSSTDGGGAFILFAIMVLVFVAVLFLIDNVRRRMTEDESDREPADR